MATLARNRSLIIGLLTFMFISTLVPAFIASAQSGPPSGEIKLENPLGEGADFIDLLKHIFSQATKILAFVVPVIIVIGAFQMMFAAGNPEKFATGQKTILYAVIGFVIILIANGIVAIVKSLLTI